MRVFVWSMLAVGAVVISAVLLIPAHSDAEVPTFPEPREEATVTIDADPEEARLDALRRAKVWRQVDPSRARLGRNPAGLSSLLSQPIVKCRYLPHDAEGTTPKFRCVLPTGDVVKVKYGDFTKEKHAEVAASRLLTALGFGADSMYVVARVRCYGCPRLPFQASWALDRLGATAVINERLPDSRYTDFEWAAVEQHFEGAELRAGAHEGWAWYELDHVDPDMGASRAELDAFRLIAVFLAHWDNKAANQRLVCLPQVSDHRCDRPFALMHDLGATFGPNKVDLEAWASTPIWVDPRRCTVSMRQLPYEGGTFREATISEEGRALLARQLKAIGIAQVRELFIGARFADFSQDPAAPDVEGWVRAFREKVDAIADAGPCPRG